MTDTLATLVFIALATGIFTCGFGVGYIIGRDIR